MNCAYSRQILALYVEDDLPSPAAVEKVESHVLACDACLQYCEQLRESQTFFKSRFKSAPHESVSQDMLTSMRRGVLSQIDSGQQALGWTVKLERFLMVGLKKQRYAAVGVVILAIVSASLLGQIRYSGPKTRQTAAVFVGKNTLLQPAGYREWVFVGSSLGLGYTQGPSSQMYHNVYMNPDAYREYLRSGKFPEGTVMVLEMLSAETKQEPELQGSYEKDFLTLEVSVKDSSRFEGGWGFYDFTEDMGKLKPQAEALSETAGCLSCHRDKAATDHVFTQFYPVLRGIGPGAI